ncbi:hypothetical protein ACIHDR_48775 [Nocardia sp. NPDC052278]|uniref:hypothetical protein n=1 Tax=unclassified Nocardia TaxID=2637762 RepID=UPI00369EBA8A
MCFIRAVTPEEGRKLAQIARRSRQPVQMRRAAVVMASAQHQPVEFIAKLMQVSERMWHAASVSGDQDRRPV